MLFAFPLVSSQSCGSSPGAGSLTSLWVLETPKLLPFELMSVSDGQIALGSSLYSSSADSSLSSSASSSSALPLTASASHAKSKVNASGQIAMRKGGASKSPPVLLDHRPALNVSESLSRIGSACMMPALSQISDGLRGRLLQEADAYRMEIQLSQKKCTLRDPRYLFVLLSLNLEYDDEYFFAGS